MCDCLFTVQRGVAMPNLPVSSVKTVSFLPSYYMYMPTKCCYSTHGVVLVMIHSNLILPDTYDASESQISMKGPVPYIVYLIETRPSARSGLHTDLFHAPQ